MSLTTDLQDLRTLLVTNLTDKGVTDADNTMGLTTLTNKISTITAGGGDSPTVTPDYYVATTGADTNAGTKAAPFLTIKKAIDTATSGQTISIGAGTYKGKDTNCDLLINKNLTIIGEAGTTLDGESSYRSGFFITRDTNCTIKKITFQNGKNQGSALSLGSGNIIEECSFLSNHSTYSRGAIKSIGYNIIKDCIFTSNTGKGIYGSRELITNCTFTQNNGSAQGAAIYAPEAGGAIAAGGSLIIDCTFTQNSSNTYGGAISGGNNTIKKCTFDQNTAIVSSYGTGGAIESWGSTNIIDCTLTNNQANKYGGAISCVSAATIRNCTITDNKALVSGAFGGGVYFSGGGNSIDYCIIKNNRIETSGYGGGVCSANDQVSNTISNSILDNNFAYYGGGFYVNGARCDITDCYMNNKSSVDKYVDIYIYNSSSVTGKISNSYGSFSASLGRYTLVNSGVSQNLIHFDIQASSYFITSGDYVQIFCHLTDYKFDEKTSKESVTLYEKRNSDPNQGTKVSDDNNNVIFNISPTSNTTYCLKTINSYSADFDITVN